MGKGFPRAEFKSVVIRVAPVFKKYHASEIWKRAQALWVTRKPWRRWRSRPVKVFPLAR